MSENDDSSSAFPCSLHAVLLRNLSQPPFNGRMLPLQTALLPSLLRFVELGERVGVARDVVCAAPTGAGKTLCYAVPVLNYVLRHVAHASPRAIIVTASKDLAEQVDKTFRSLLRGDSSVRVVSLFGAAKRNLQRERALVVDAHVLITTPTRWLDFVDSLDGTLSHADAASRIKFFIVDEADKLVTSAPFVQRHAAALALPPADDYYGARENAFTCRWLFSATLTRDETELEHTFSLRHTFSFCRDEMALPDTLALQYKVVANAQHRLSALKRLLSAHIDQRILVFANSVDACQQLLDELTPIYGDKVAQYSSRESVQDRTAALRRFRVLVCTDAAARGLDIPDLPLVIHYEHPALRQTFVHRSGRTARAGAKGVSISLLFPSQVYFFRQWAGRGATKLDDASSGVADAREPVGAAERGAANVGDD